MPVVSKETLKTYFENGKVPNYNKYVDLIDTLGYVSWEDIEGIPSTFPPTTHTHPGTDITGTLFHRTDQNIVNANDAMISGGVTVGSSSDLASAGQIAFTNSLVSRKNSASYLVAGVLFLQQPVTVYNNVTRTSANNGDFSLSTIVPNNTLGVFVNGWLSSSVINTYAYFGTPTVGTQTLPVYTQAANAKIGFAGFIPTYLNAGVPYLTATYQTGATFTITAFKICGYII